MSFALFSEMCISCISGLKYYNDRHEQNQVIYEPQKCLHDKWAKVHI